MAYLPVVISAAETAYTEIKAADPAAASAFFSAVGHWLYSLVPITEAVLAPSADASTAAGHPKELS